MRKSPLTSLSLLRQRCSTPLRPPRIDLSDFEWEKIKRLWIAEGILPNRQRKGKSGEILRRGGK